MKETIIRKYWRSNKELFADRTDKEVFSQHTNALAILTGTVDGDKALAIAQRIEAGDSLLAPASIYFKFYTHEAMTKAGLGNHYLSWLGIWRDYLKLGLTTCGETSDINATRSDCHAWGASPNIEFFRTVLGIDSDAPCFSHVVITPRLGAIKKIGGTMPTPYGNITVDYTVKGDGLTASVSLPQQMTGTLYWKGNEWQLKGGTNELKIKDK